MLDIVTGIFGLVWIGLAAKNAIKDETARKYELICAELVAGMGMIGIALS